VSTFELADHHETFRKVVRDFAEREVAPHVAEWDLAHHFPTDVVRKMGELGLFGLAVPEEYGGSGGDFHVRVRGHRGTGPGRPVARASRSRPGWAWASTRS
jgi:alkylation response protein AidB-like acyl-CoA dehydrogenase